MEVDPLERRASYVSSLSSRSSSAVQTGSVQKVIDYLRAESIRLLILDSHSRTLSASYGPSTIFGGSLAGQDMPTLLVRAKQNVLVGLEEKLRAQAGEEYEADERVGRMKEELSMAFVELDSSWRRWTEDATKPMSFASC